MDKTNKSLNSIRKIARAFESEMDPKYKVAEMSIVYNEIVKPADRPRITGSSDAAEVLRPLMASDMQIRELFHALYLNRLNRVVAAYKIGVGGVAGTVADLKLIYFGAIHHLASGIVLCHNHPSGNPRPSQADIQLTRKAREAGKLFEIMVLDHIILTSDGYFSFADEGMM